MDVKTINPVLEAFAEIIPQIGFQSIEKKKISLQESSLENNGVMISVSVVGPLKGCILISMTLESAKRFASTMMMGMPIEEFDDMAQSAI
jgi:chemotaxis protein CheX